MNIVILILVLIISFLYIWKVKSNKIPGPKGYPIIGNLFDLKGEMHLKFDEWYKIYGPIYKIQLGSIDTIVLTEYQTIKESFIDNSSIFTPRFQKKSRNFKMLNESISNSNGDIHKHLKNIVLSEMTSVRIKKMEGHISDEIKRLVKLLDKHADSGQPFLFNDYIRMFSINIILRFLFGVTFPYNNLEDGIGIIGSIKEFFYVGGQPFLSDFIPFLSILPSKNHKRYKEIVSLLKNHILEQIEIYKKRVLIEKEGADVINIDEKENYTILDILLNEVEKGSISEESLVGNVISILTGGTDTSSGSIIFTIIELINNKEYQDKLYKEIKNSIENNNDYDDILPITYSNYKQSINYLNNVIKETYRKYPAGPLALPHITSEDITFNGYKIKKGTQILKNIYSTHHNEKYWAQPNKYIPERFSSNNSEKSPSLSINHTLIHFGLGRRCVGSSLADSEIFTCLASLFNRYEFLNPNPSKPLNDTPKFGVALSPPDNLIILKKRI